MSLVLDASATLAWVFQDEMNESAQRFLDRVIEQGAWVPVLWRLEVVSGLNAGIRRGRIDADYRDEALAALSLHDIKMDPETWENAWSATLRLADRFGLTPYDAAYIEVAQRRSLPLAALDADMCAAADALGLGLA